MNKSSPTLVFIHGANATAHSFNFIRAHFSEYAHSCLHYSSLNSFQSNLAQMKDFLSAANLDEIFFVAHSLGGVYAVYLAELFNASTRGAVSIATPFNGSKSAYGLGLYKPCQLYEDITPTSNPMLKANKLTISCPWTQIITTGGHSHLLDEPNDGVVTKASMEHRKDVNTIDIHSGHYEIMMHPDTIDVIYHSLNSLG